MFSAETFEYLKGLPVEKWIEFLEKLLKNESYFDELLNSIIGIRHCGISQNHSEFDYFPSNKLHQIDNPFAFGMVTRACKECEHKYGTHQDYAQMSGCEDARFD